MNALKLNKASLSFEQKNLKNYKKYLPSLELKRKKLLGIRAGIDEAVIILQEREIALKAKAQTHFFMVKNSLDDVVHYLQFESLETESENIVGVQLPVFKEIHWSIKEYAYLNTPHWFDAFLQFIKEWVELKLRIQVTLTRMHLLDKAIQTVTQRKNLFEKVLIPNALSHIRLIQIFLSDNERAAVVRSKIAKKKKGLLL